MRTFYSTTKATFFDTPATAKGKWLQVLNSGPATGSGRVAEPPTTENKFHDTRLITLQKIITSLQ